MPRRPESIEEGKVRKRRNKMSWQSSKIQLIGRIALKRNLDIARDPWLPLACRRLWQDGVGD